MGIFSKLITAVAGPLVSGLIGGVTSARGAETQNKAAAAAAQKQMDFQKETLQNQWQWGMADMKKAGLNPILAYQKGGAGTAGGSSYTPVNVGAAGVAGAASGINSALSKARYELEKKSNIATINALYEQGTKNSMEGDLAYQNRLNAMKQGELLQQQKLMNQPTVNSARTAAKFWNTPAGKRAVVIDLLGRSANPMAKAYKTGSSK